MKNILNKVAIETFNCLLNNEPDKYLSLIQEYLEYIKQDKQDISHLLKTNLTIKNLATLIYKISHSKPKKQKAQPKTNEKSKSKQKAIKDVDLAFVTLAKKFTEPGTTLKNYRFRFGFNQKNLAQKIGIEPRELSKMELGKLAIPQDVARRMGMLFDTDYRIFLK